MRGSAGRLAALFIFGICFAPAVCAGAREEARLPFEWPPQVGKLYPDLALSTPGGASRKISDFKGKVIIIEMIGMSCPACQTWAGARSRGAFEGVSPQPDLQPFDQTFQKYTGGLTLDDPRIVYIQMLLFNMQMKTPTPDDVRRWSSHFHRNLSRPPILIAGVPEFLAPRYYQATYNLIPGFHIIDTRGILRYDAAGDHPRHNLWTEALPAVPGLLKTVSKDDR